MACRGRGGWGRVVRCGGRGQPAPKQRPVGCCGAAAALARQTRVARQPCSHCAGRGGDACTAHDLVDATLREVVAQLAPRRVARVLRVDNVVAAHIKAVACAHSGHGESTSRPRLAEESACTHAGPAAEGSRGGASSLFVFAAAGHVGLRGLPHDGKYLLNLVGLVLACETTCTARRAGGGQAAGAKAS